MQELEYDRPVDVLKVVSGDAAEYIVTHPGRSQYSQAGGGVSACGIAALNCARKVLGLDAAGVGSEHLVQELMNHRLLEVSSLIFLLHDIILTRKLHPGCSPTLSDMVKLYPSRCG